MTEDIAVHAREALGNLPEETSHGERPPPEHVYLPPSHLKAMHPDSLLVTGMRGAGKTFWWSALQDSAVRHMVSQQTDRTPLTENTEIRTGFGVTPAPEEYPSKDVLRNLLSDGLEPRIVWRTVHALQLSPCDHPLRKMDSWSRRARFVAHNPEPIEILFHECDLEFQRRGVYVMILFDALDRCSDDWKEMYRFIRGLLQTALELRPYRRLRVKVFLRSDQVNESEIGDFPDASKVLSSSVELSWPRRELYGLLWHYLANGLNGDHFRFFLGKNDWPSVRIGENQVFTNPREVAKEDHQRVKFHDIAGPWMGRGPKRGFPYTWIPNHLADTEGRVSPRSFLAALRKAAGDTDNEYPEHGYALHYDSIKRGVQEASKIRVSELQEDYPWVDGVLNPLQGMVVPCAFDEISKRWKNDGVLHRLAEDVGEGGVKLPPLHLTQGPDGVREDLESLGIFQRMRDGRVNIPDVFRVGYGLGRRGGVRPIR